MNREIEISSFNGDIIHIDLSKCFTTQYVAFENMVGTGIINNIIQSYGGGDGDRMFTYQYIYIDPNISETLHHKFYENIEYEKPIVLSSINCEEFCKKFDDNEFKLTPLKEAMFNIICLIVLYEYICVLSEKEFYQNDPIEYLLPKKYQGKLSQSELVYKIEEIVHNMKIQKRIEVLRKIFKEGYDVLEFIEIDASQTIIDVIHGVIKHLMDQCVDYISDRNVEFMIKHSNGSLKIIK